MTPEDQAKLKNLFRTEEGKLLLEKVIEIILKNSDVRKIKEDDDVSVTKQALAMFTDWIYSIFGEINSFDLWLEAEKKKKKILEESIYSVTKD